MVMGLNLLDQLLHEEVLERFDHRHLNHDIPEFAFGRQIPTAEALAIHTWQRLEPRLPTGIQLECVRIQEDPGLYAEYRGERK